METRPKVTVITPSYNQGQFIEETIQSVLNQTYSNIEYLVIDGGSNDNTVDILAKYNDSITYWVSEKDKGQTNAINKGITKATGEIICWINSDDILMPWAIADVVTYFAANPARQILNGYTMRVDKQTNIMYTHFVPKPLKWFAKHGVYYINQPSMFFKRSLLNCIGGLDERFHARMDQEFVMRTMSEKFEFGMIPKVLAAIRIHEDTKTSQNGAIWDHDIKVLELQYSGVFKLRRDLIGKLSYLALKCLSLDYMKQFLFTLKWKNQSIHNYWQMKKFELNTRLIPAEQFT